MRSERLTTVQTATRQVLLLISRLSDEELEEYGDKTRLLAADEERAAERNWLWKCAQMADAILERRKCPLRNKGSL